MIIDCARRLFGTKFAKQEVDCSPIIWGAAGALVISVLFYFAQVFGMRNWLMPLEFMRDKWYLVSPLVLGFGVQMGLFRAIRQKARQGSATLIASGGVSTTSMIACCMHNFTSLLPILGLTGIATFFSMHQTQVFLASILFVIVGTVYMWKKYCDVHAHCEMEKESDLLPPQVRHVDA